MIRILLTTMMLACPLLCRSGGCSLAEECCVRDSNRSACCDDDQCAQQRLHHDHSYEQHSDHPPADNGRPVDDVPCGHCQCICGGAVIVQQDDDAHLTQPMVAPLDNVVDTSEVVADLQLQRHPHRFTASGGRVSPGRILCMLHESLLL